MSWRIGVAFFRAQGIGGPVRDVLCFGVQGERYRRFCWGLDYTDSSALAPNPAEPARRPSPLELAEQPASRPARIANFARVTLSGCIGCVGDLVTRRAHFGIFPGEEVRGVRSIAAGYELHLDESPLNPDGAFETGDATVRHPARTVTGSTGHWGGSVSNIPGQPPGLVVGFNPARFEESNGSAGEGFGTFPGLSEQFKASAE